MGDLTWRSSAFLAEQENDLELQAIGVLEFVDQERSDLLLDLLPRPKMITQQISRSNQHLRKVEGGPPVQLPAMALLELLQQAANNPLMRNHGPSREVVLQPQIAISISERSVLHCFERLSKAVTSFRDVGFRIQSCAQSLKAFAEVFDRHSGQRALACDKRRPELRRGRAIQRARFCHR